MLSQRVAEMKMQTVGNGRLKSPCWNLVVNYGMMLVENEVDALRTWYLKRSN